MSISGCGTENPDAEEESLMQSKQNKVRTIILTKSNQRLR